ncbi:hypothetical protein evm_010191 [Chilo suppressalis]|nr:hypothetical protein evm_010191 [Chilo suppressalis]
MLPLSAKQHPYLDHKRKKKSSRKLCQQSIMRSTTQLLQIFTFNKRVKELSTKKGNVTFSDKMLLFDLSRVTFDYRPLATLLNTLALRRKVILVIHYLSVLYGKVDAPGVLERVCWCPRAPYTSSAGWRRRAGAAPAPYTPASHAHRIRRARTHYARDPTHRGHARSM